MNQFTNAQNLLALCQKEKISIAEAALRREVDNFDASREEVIARMAHSWDIMKQAVKDGQTPGNHSMGGLIGGEGLKMTSYGDAHSTEKGSLLGQTVSKAAGYAMGVLEVNASMGLIVAAPTAGSSGVIPGVYRSVQETYQLQDEAMIRALFTAGGVGYLITRNGTVSGAEGGCQAEIGSAAAMASAGVVELLGGTPQQALSAASCVMGCMLGLVCDPIGGLVEAPCQKRNAIGASNALVCAQMALSGVESLIPFDEMVEVMDKVGRSIPYTLRETALGGIAGSHTACELCSRKGTDL